MTYQTTGKLNHARRHWQHALTLYTDLGISYAETVRAQLTAIAKQAGEGVAE